METVFTSANFDADVLGSEIPVVVDFFATWCGPCRMMAPVIEELAEEYDGKVKIGKLDVDENSDIAARYGVMSIPTIILLRTEKFFPRALDFRIKKFWKMRSRKCCRKYNGKAGKPACLLAFLIVSFVSVF